jgi:hypothetical protein
MRQLVAECRVGRKWRFNGKHAAVSERPRDVDMLGIQQVAEHDVEQGSVTLNDGEHSGLGVHDVIEIKLNSEHQPASPNARDQHREFALKLPQPLL